VTDRCVVRLSEERWARKQEHWQAVATAASEQSGRTRVPRVQKALDLRDWLPACPADTLKLVLSPGIEPHRAALTSRPKSALLLVGPEGGLSEMELRLTDLAGFVGLPLGPRVLRTETAGVVALSVLQALWGDLGAAFQLGK
jgi:16S rRNA (uracil1498-N3)-methyltransferase